MAYLRTSLLLLGSLLQLLITLRGLDAQSANCSLEVDVCGSNSNCSGDGLCECNPNSFSISGSNIDCTSSSEPDPLCIQFGQTCVFCGLENEGPCRWCTAFLSELQGSVEPTCVDSCPAEEFEIRRILEIQSGGIARVCMEPGVMTASLPQWAIIVIVVGAVLLILVAGTIIVILLVRTLYKSSHGAFDVESSHGNIEKTAGDTMRTKRSNSFSFQRESKKKLVHENPIITNLDDSSDDEIDGDDETIFKHKLNKLRGKAEIYLQMLNEMRRRAKELTQGSPADEQYRKVMRDVTRLLYLLNKKPSNVRMPSDGVELLKWAEGLLKRYLAGQEKQGTLKSNEVPSYFAAANENKNEEEFMERLARLRDHSEVFLRMLNEMRRRLKELRPETPTAQNYKTTTKDVTRLLEMLNKRPSTVKMPPDGMEMVKKAEQLLERYLASQVCELPPFSDQKGNHQEVSDYGVQDETNF